MVFVFFFQAEDGIRDVAVTGVQTCALPIFGMAQTAQWRPADDHAYADARAHGHVGPGVEAPSAAPESFGRSEEHTSELQSRLHLVCRLLLEKKKKPA